MDMIEVTICMGTTCYVMGAGDLMSLADELEDDLKNRVTIKGASCLGLCKHGQYGKAPFVQVGSTVISEATLLKIVQTLKAL